MLQMNLFDTQDVALHRCHAACQQSPFLCTIGSACTGHARRLTHQQYATCSHCTVAFRLPRKSQRAAVRPVPGRRSAAVAAGKVDLDAWIQQSRESRWQWLEVSLLLPLGHSSNVSLLHGLWLCTCTSTGPGTAMAAALILPHEASAGLQCVPRQSRMWA